MFVPVVDRDQKPLMPTTASRARRWIKIGKATPFWKRGVFCVRLNVEPSGHDEQKIAVGIDPGSKKEGFTVKSAAHTYLNIQTDAVTWVKKAVATRKELRSARRRRNAPCRRATLNRSRRSFSLGPSTKARWQWKLRILNWLSKMYPIQHVIVEDIKAKTKKGAKRWNANFSPLEHGKSWFYDEIKKAFSLTTKLGFETKRLREATNLKKSSHKLSNCFEAHCVDSWVLANQHVGGHIQPDNTEVLLIYPLHFHRRQLHKLQPSTGGVRRSYGGTRSLGFKRGSLVKYRQGKVFYVGGHSQRFITLHNVETGQRSNRFARPENCKFLTYSSWRAVRASKLQDKKQVQKRRSA